MVNVIYSKEVGIKQQSGDASFTIPVDIPVVHPINQTVLGNSVASLNFGVLVHGTGNQLANNIDLNGKYIQFRSASGDFYAWFNIDGGSTDPQLSGQPIQINGAVADVNQANEIVALLLTKLQLNAGFMAEFHVSAANPAILDVCAKRMGNVGSIVSDVSSLQGIEDNSGVEVSVGLSQVSGTGSHMLEGIGLSKAGDSDTKAGGGAFVIVKDLQQDANYGVRKIILSSHPEDVEIRSESGDVLGTFDAAGETLHLVWNGSTWKSLT